LPNGFEERIMISQPVSTQDQQNTAPSLIKLGACLFYELLVLIAISFVSACLFIGLLGDATHGMKRVFFQVFIWAVIGAYFVRSWVVQGQTLPMRSWKLKLVVQNSGQLLSYRIAVLRYILATIGLILFGVGFFWRFIDREHLFLHDRLLNTRLIYLNLKR
jgi:uncharacterized RDD family membrane protein YckC